MKKSKKLNVPEDCCQISFGYGRYHRGEIISADFDKNKRVIGIELLSSMRTRKPCQEEIAGSANSGRSRK